MKIEADLDDKSEKDMNDLDVQIAMVESRIEKKNTCRRPLALI